MQTGLTVAAILPDGSQVDVTEGVQAAYDLAMVVLSIDMGSLIGSIDEILPLRGLAKACGFDQTPVDEYDATWTRAMEWRSRNPPPPPPPARSASE